MKIGFYGASTVCWRDDELRRSFIDQIQDHFVAEIVNIGVPQGSEERILFELKKTKKLDVAIVFHSLPKYIFLPRCTRDITLESVKPKKANILWTERAHDEIPTYHEFKKEFFNYGGIDKVFKTTENFVESVHTMREYFYHPDLAVNRFQASMLAIDSFLLANNIPVLHSVFPDHTPDWLKPKSGHIDNQNYTTWNWTLEQDTNPFTPNNLTIQQNKVIADDLINWITNTIRP